MNCKPGDLAVIVKTGPNAEHLLGRVVQLGKRVSNPFPWCKYGWTYKGKQLELSGKWKGSFVSYLEDEALRPIRDNDGTDESLTWTPKREGVPA